jgi:tRNA-Thr(GGU) m(6)t(6)A37 methyltransferase TsaA
VEKDEVEPIGTIHSPFKDVANMPIQPTGAADVEGTVHIRESCVEGLKDLEGFSHIYLIYLFHKAKRISLTVTPFMDSTARGVFATRSPLRPNHIGLSIVQLVKIENGILTVKGVDVLDGTPLLDIKPYIRNFDSVEKSLSGWMVANKGEVAKKRSDGRFK